VVGATRDGSGVHLAASDGSTISATRVVSCAGLHSDRLARLMGLDTDVQIIPFRGEYWHLRRPELVRSMIYPVPDPRFPFLGLHYTRRIDGTVEVGPNAVLAFAREGYRWRTIDWGELAETLRWPGLRTLARKYWRTGTMEVTRSLIGPLLVRAARRLIPEVGSDDLVRAGAGVRAQAVGRDGTLMDDFVIVDDGSVAAVLNAPSPAATASLAIAEEIVNRL
jgi:L-2-hydroxyglutarate oxidase LhgO